MLVENLSEIWKREAIDYRSWEFGHSDWSSSWNSENAEWHISPASLKHFKMRSCLLFSRIQSQNSSAQPTLETLNNMAKYFNAELFICNNGLPPLQKCRFYVESSKHFSHRLSIPHGQYYAKQNIFVVFWSVSNCIHLLACTSFSFNLNSAPYKNFISRMYVLTR